VWTLWTVGWSIPWLIAGVALIWIEPLATPVAIAAIATGVANGSIQMSATPAAIHGIDQPTVHRVQIRPHRRNRSRSIGGRHGTAASSGRAALSN
jgi:hypothetical protein